MIKSISQTGRYTVVTGGSTAGPYINTYSGSTMVGQLRYNPATSNIEVYDGNNWLMYSSNYATVGLTAEAESLLDWARQKRDEERLLEKQAQESPAIKDLVDSIKEKQHQVKMIQALLNSPGNDPEQSVMMAP